MITQCTDLDSLVCPLLVRHDLHELTSQTGVFSHLAQVRKHCWQFSIASEQLLPHIFLLHQSNYCLTISRNELHTKTCYLQNVHFIDIVVVSWGRFLWCLKDFFFFKNTFPMSWINCLMDCFLSILKVCALFTYVPYSVKERYIQDRKISR